MDSITSSLLQQKAKGTFQRNKQIRQLAKDGENYAQIGRWFKLTRQSIRKIVSEPGGHNVGGGDNG